MGTQTQAIMNIEQAEQRASQTISRIVNQAQALVIDDDDSYEFGGEVLKLIVAKKKELDADDFLGGMTRAAHQTWKKSLAIFKKYYDPLDTSDGIIRNKMLTFDRKRAEEKRQKELAEAEKLRMEQQATAEAEAKQLEATGEPELAAMVREEAKMAPPPVVVMQPATPKLEGVSVRENWTWKFTTDEESALRMIVKAAAQDDRFLALLCLNTKVLNSMAKSQKKLMKVPGVQSFDQGGIAVRA